MDSNNQLKEIEELCKGARRYRWLRKQTAIDGGFWVAQGWIELGLSNWHGESLDNKIDAAMS